MGFILSHRKILRSEVDADKTEEQVERIDEATFRERPRATRLPETRQNRRRKSGPALVRKRQFPPLYSIPIPNADDRRRAKSIQQCLRLREMHRYILYNESVFHIVQPKKRGVNCETYREKRRKNVAVIRKDQKVSTLSDSFRFVLFCSVVFAYVCVIT